MFARMAGTFALKNTRRSFNIYECEDCSDCPFKAKCTKAMGNRRVLWNTLWEELKAKAKEPLRMTKNPRFMLRREVEVESVFGHLKGNRSFRRFSLRKTFRFPPNFVILETYWKLIAEGRIKAEIDSIFPLNQADKALGKAKQGMDGEEFC